MSTPPGHLDAPRLRVRAWEEADAPALWDLISGEQARLAADFPRTLAAIGTAARAAEFIGARRQAWAVGTGFQYGLWRHQQPARCVGFVSLRDVQRDPLGVAKAEVAYFLRADCEGQGLMGETLRAVLPAAFGSGLEKLFARVQPANQRSRQLLERVGFRYGGRLRRDFRTPAGELVDVDYFDLLPGEVQA